MSKATFQSAQHEQFYKLIYALTEDGTKEFHILVRTFYDHMNEMPCT